MRSFRLWITWRLSLSERAAGRCSSMRTTPTSMMASGGVASRRTAVRPRRRPCRISSERAGDALDLERLDHVADLDVVHAVERDTALEAALDLLHIVLEAAQRSDSPGPDRHA